MRSDGRLRALHLAEYGAQAMAVHDGLVSRAAGDVARPGYLVSLREVELPVECLLGGDGNWQYRFRVEHAGETLATGRAAVMQARTG